MAATVRDVYVTEIVRVLPHSMAAEAETGLLSIGGDEVYVVGETGQLLGLVPDYELLKLRMLNLLDTAAAIDVMTPCPSAVTPDTPLEEAACRLRVHVHRSLPVIDDGQLVGRVERRSILKWYAARPETGQDRVAIRIAPGRPRFLEARAPRTATRQSVTD